MKAPPPRNDQDDVIIRRKGDRISFGARAFGRLFPTRVVGATLWPVRVCWAQRFADRGRFFK